MDSVLQKLISAHVSKQIKHWSRSPNMATKVKNDVLGYIYSRACAKQEPSVDLIVHIVVYMFHVFDKYGLDIEYSDNDVVIPAEALFKKWEAYKNGVGEDMLDILDI